MAPKLRIALAPREPLIPIFNQNALRMRKYRERKRANRDQYDRYCEQERSRSKLRRIDCTKEQRDKERLRSRVRSQNYRDRQKDNGKKETKAGKPGTRTTIVAQRLYWSQKKRESREKLGSQKKRRIKEYDRQRHSQHVSVQTSKPVEVTNEDFSTPEARRKAVSRMKRSAPKVPNKFASTVSNLISSSSPRKKRALSNLGIYSPQKKKLLEETMAAVKATIGDMAGKRQSAVQRKRHGFVRSLSQHYSNLKLAKEPLGIRKEYLLKCSVIPEEDFRKTRNDSLSEEVISKVRDFYIQPEVSVVLPDARKVKHGLSRHILQKTVNQSYTDFKSLYPGLKVGRSKFASLRPEHVKSQNKTTLNQCICEYCANIELKLQTLQKISEKAKRPDIRGNISNRFSLINSTLCQKTNGAKFYKNACINRNCSDCGVENVRKIMAPMKSQDAAQWYKWGLIKQHSGTSYKGLVSVQGSNAQLIEDTCQELEMMSLHIFNASWQYSQFTSLISNIPNDVVVLVLDFGQNYACFYQDEAQSAHWYHEQVTIHPIVAYYRCPKDDEIIKEELIFLSNDKIHDAHAVSKFVTLANHHLQDVRQVRIIHQIQFSDGCSSQYKSRNPFQQISSSISEYGFPVTRAYFGSRHGKGPCDGATGVIKSFVRNAVKARRAVVANSHDMYNYCNLHMSRENQYGCCHKPRKFFLVEDIDRSTEFTAKSVEGTRKIHCVKAVADMAIQTRNLACFCKPCLENKPENCINKEYVETWINVNLETGKTVKDKQKTTEKSSKKTKPKKSLKKTKMVKNPKDVHVEMSAPTGDRETDFQNVQLYLEESAVISDLRRKVTQVESVLLLHDIVGNASRVSVLSVGLPVDSEALKLIPGDHEGVNRFPICVRGDGNCLPRCGSIFAFGHENWWQEVRVRIAVEMILNSDRYLDIHELRRGLGLDDNAAALNTVQCLALFSNADIPSGKLTKEVIENAFNDVTMKCLTNGNFLGMWELLAMANVLGCQIQSVYPKMGSDLVRTIINRNIIPVSLKTTDVATILWSRVGPALSPSVWSPNHFAPLLSIVDTTSLENEATETTADLSFDMLDFVPPSDGSDGEDVPSIAEILNCQKYPPNFEELFSTSNIECDESLTEVTTELDLKPEATIESDLTACVKYSPGDFVIVALKIGKRQKDYVAEILEIDNNEVNLNFMQAHGELYQWPSCPDVSWELLSCIKSALPAPQLDEKRSSNRQQMFSFLQN